VRGTKAVPADKLDAGFFRDVIRQVFVGDKDDLSALEGVELPPTALVEVQQTSSSALTSAGYSRIQ